MTWLRVIRGAVHDAKDMLPRDAEAYADQALQRGLRRLEEELRDAYLAGMRAGFAEGGVLVAQIARIGDVDDAFALAEAERAEEDAS